MTVGHFCIIDSVDRSCPKTNCPPSDKPSRWTVVIFPENATKIVDHLFETLKLLAPFPCHEFVLCFFLHRLSENPASVHFQGNPPKWIWKFFFWLGGSKYNTTFLKFRNSRIFPETPFFFRTEGVFFRLLNIRQSLPQS